MKFSLSTHKFFKFPRPTSSLTCAGHLLLTLLPSGIIPASLPLWSCSKTIICTKSNGNIFHFQEESTYLLRQRSHSPLWSSLIVGLRLMMVRICTVKKGEMERTQTCYFSYLRQRFPKGVLGGTMFMYNKEKRGFVAKRV